MTASYEPFDPAPGQFGYRSPDARRVSDSRVGWILLGAGAVIAIAAFLPWATTSERSIAGTQGDGVITVVIGVLLAALGFLIGRGYGRLWVGVTACVLAGLTTLAALADVNNVAHFSTDFADSTLTVSVGIGLWLTTAAAVVALGASAWAIWKRASIGS